MNLILYLEEFLECRYVRCQRVIDPDTCVVCLRYTCAMPSSDSCDFLSLYLQKLKPHPVEAPNLLFGDGRVIPLPFFWHFVIFLSCPVFLSLRATATQRGQIIFKDALAQQLCEQGGEDDFYCLRCLFETPDRSELNIPLQNAYAHNMSRNTSQSCEKVTYRISYLTGKILGQGGFFGKETEVTGLIVNKWSGFGWFHSSGEFCNVDISYLKSWGADTALNHWCHTQGEDEGMPKLNIKHHQYLASWQLEEHKTAVKVEEELIFL